MGSFPIPLLAIRPSLLNKVKGSSPNKHFKRLASEFTDTAYYKNEPNWGSSFETTIHAIPIHQATHCARSDNAAAFGIE